VPVAQQSYNGGNRPIEGYLRYPNLPRPTS
jgi:hypothetical protein